MPDKKKEYFINFQGALLTVKQAKRVGISLIVGTVGVLFTLFLLPVKTSRMIGILVIAAFTAVGYFVVSKRIK